MDTKRNIKPGCIEEELASLWKAKPEKDQLKACLFNLVVYTQDPYRIKYFEDLIQKIMEKFPCRVLFIQGDPNTSASFLNVHVSTEFGAHPTSPGCDQITIETSKDKLETIPFIILPHFIADLPIYLLWGEDPTKDDLPILNTLLQYATRLIFDSEWTDNLQRFSKTILERLKKPVVDMMDMNWTRISGWREVLAQTFDSPEQLEHFQKTKLVKISYNSKKSELFSHHETQAIYLQAWLAIQLGWKFESIEKKDSIISIYYSSPINSIRIDLCPQLVQKLAPEEIIKIEIAADETSYYSLERHGPAQVIIHRTTEDQCHLPFHLLLPNTRPNTQFIKEIFYHRMSQDYLKMLELVSQINWDTI